MLNHLLDRLNWFPSVLMHSNAILGRFYGSFIIFAGNIFTGKKKSNLRTPCGWRILTHDSQYHKEFKYGYGVSFAICLRFGDIFV